jgi:hypothetical protein
MLSHETWIHEKTGNLYSVISEGKVKLNDKWEPSVNYQRLSFNLKDDTETVYTRTKEDFIKNFKPKI